jgi:hypothetical protein
LNTYSDAKISLKEGSVGGSTSIMEVEPPKKFFDKNFIVLRKKNQFI